MMESAPYRRYQFQAMSLIEMSNAGNSARHSPWRFAIAPMMKWTDSAAISSVFPDEIGVLLSCEWHSGGTGLLDLARGRASVQEPCDV
jgi:hypothetical protein